MLQSYDSRVLSKELFEPEAIKFDLTHIEIMYPDSDLALIPFRVGDVGLENLLTRWFKDKAVTKHLHPNTPFTSDPTKKVSVLEFISHVVSSPVSAYFKVINLDAGGKNSLSYNTPEDTIGFASIHSIDYKRRTFSRGIVIGEKSSWGMGKAKKIGELILTRTKELGFMSATARSKTDNIASVSNLTKQLGLPEIKDGVAIFELDFAKWPNINQYDNPATTPSYIWHLLKSELSP